MLLFVGLGGGVLYEAVAKPIQDRFWANGLAKDFGLIISNGLLIVIIMEIVETIRQQILANERLNERLIKNFLVIGIVSAIRHLLAVGAELSFLGKSGSELPQHPGLLWELAINGLVVALLLIGFRSMRKETGRQRARNRSVTSTPVTRWRPGG
jgi:hypothetical protein